MGDEPTTGRPDATQESLQQLPSITDLLKSGPARAWLERHPAPLVTECLRRAVASARKRLASASPEGPPAPVSETHILFQAGQFLDRALTPRIREAINATGIILHTGLGRAVFSETVLDGLAGELRGCCTLAVDVTTGERAERDELVEPILCELTGAEAATVVNNNAAATLLVLAGLAAGREVIVSRGQLIEIGGSFRLPEVMAQSGAKLVEVGATNRTHLKDYGNAITAETAALMRVHPSNYRIVGFTSEVPVRELAGLARERGLVLIDDLGAGALVDLKSFGLPHEPTARESLQAGADVVLFSGDKLIGGSQAGIIAGRKVLVDRLRRHPLMRAMRADKTCLMILERTLQLFRNPARLREENPTYRMLATSVEVLERRARALAEAIAAAAPGCRCEVAETAAYLGSGSLPTEALPSRGVRVSAGGVAPDRLARRLREDPACVFCRIEADRLVLDVRTLADDQAPTIAAAFARVLAAPGFPAS